MRFEDIRKIGFGGGCHWCTEGVYQSLIGIDQVDQGWISSKGKQSNFSEAVVVHFDQRVICLASLIEIHLYTHASTSNHSMRDKYRSAIYTFDDVQLDETNKILSELKSEFDKTIITQVLPFAAFKENKVELADYFYQSPNKPFCKSYIHPKLKLLLSRFNSQVNIKKLDLAGVEFASDSSFQQD